KDNHIFQSRPVETRLIIPLPDVTRGRLEQFRPTEEKAQAARAHERLSYLDLHQRLLEQYGPPSILVNEEHEIVHVSESAGRYLQVRGGEPTNNLLKLIRPELRLELRTALYQAVNNRTNLEARGIQVRVDGGEETVNVIVRPVLREEDPTRGFVLILFE